MIFPSNRTMIAFVSGVGLSILASFIYAAANSDGMIAYTIKSSCALQTRERTELCYERATSALYPQYPVARIFTIMSSLQAQDPRFISCHRVAHAIGRIVAASDPDGWFANTHLNPSDSPCDGGYLHGMLAERFRFEQLSQIEILSMLPKFRHSCEPAAEWSPSLMQAASCWHSLGHMYFSITAGDIRKAVRLCVTTFPENSGDRAKRRACYNGAFMEAFTASVGENDEFIAPTAARFTKDTVGVLCASFSDSLTQSTCHQRSFVLFATDNADTSRVHAFCSAESNADEREYCRRRAYHSLAYTWFSTQPTLRSACTLAPSSDQLLCFETQVLTLFTVSALPIPERTRQAISFCKSQAPASMQRGCLESLANAGPFFFLRGSQELTAFCSELPHEHWPACLSPTNDGSSYWALDAGTK